MSRRSSPIWLPGAHRGARTPIRILSLALLLAIAGPGAAIALDPADLPNAIENAETPADHEALAAYFEGEAKEARAMAERHRKMAATYRSLRKPAGHKGVRARLERTMPKHCDELVARYEADAKDYEAMAAEHREAASAIK